MPDVGLAAVFTCLDKDITISDAIRAGVWWEAWMHRYLRDDLCASVARSPPRPGPSRADSGEVVLDIGANIGTHTVALAKMGWRVIAFEPQRQVYELLHANILVNGCTRVNAFHMGLSNEGGSLRMARYSLAQGANMGGVPLGKEHTGELVTVQKLDDVLAALGGPRVRLIKIDVEGHERQVFEGGAATLRRDRPIIYFEDHTGENQRWLRAFGYSIERFAEGSNDFRHSSGSPPRRTTTRSCWRQGSTQLARPAGSASRDAQGHAVQPLSNLVLNKTIQNPGCARRRHCCHWSLRHPEPLPEGGTTAAAARGCDITRKARLLVSGSLARSSNPGPRPHVPNVALARHQSFDVRIKVLEAHLQELLEFINVLEHRRIFVERLVGIVQTVVPCINLLAAIELGSRT